MRSCRAFVIALLPALLMIPARAAETPSAAASATGETGATLEVRRPLETLIPIAAGNFTMGASMEQQGAALELCREELGARHAQACQPELFLVEGPARMVYLPAFSIDRVEVTVESYRACVQAGRCGPEPLLQADARMLEPRNPVTMVAWGEAARYCRFRGARLPTEAEWERAARGRDGRTWPWGNIARAELSNHGRFIRTGELDSSAFTMLRPDSSDGFLLLAPVGSFRGGASPDGVLDMAGNVMEWTADVFQEEPPQRSQSVSPHGPAAGALRTLRGGSWRQPRFYQRTTAREGALPETRSPEIGFRCAR